MTAPTLIRRRFADVAHGQILYRTAGSGPPLVMLHASPGSSRQMGSLIRGFADVARVIAPDTPGNGDSDALPLEEPSIVDLARALLGLFDELGLESIRLYGSHTGAAIAAELAILAPQRIDRLVLDGVQLLTAEARADMLARYAFPFPPDLDGAYLARVFQFCRDQYLFYPWYDRTAAGRRPGGLPSPHALHSLVVDVLKTSETYQRAYRAALGWLAAERLPLVGCPTLLIAADNDPLADDTRGAAALLRDGRHVALPRFDAPAFASTRDNIIAGFLGLDR